MSSALEPNAVLRDEDNLFEVVNGQRVELSPMGAQSTYIANRLCHKMMTFSEAKKLGLAVSEMLFVLDETGKEKRRPDVAFVSVNRWPMERELPPIGDWELSPTWRSKSSVPTTSSTMS